MEEHSGYYTADVTALTFRQLWRRLPMPVLLKPLAVMFFYFHRWQSGNRASVGYPWPEALNVVSTENVPHEVLEQFTPFFQFCVDAGFTLKFFFVSSGVGSGATTIYSAVLLDATCLISAVTVCEADVTGEVVLSQGSYSFQSGLTDGSLLLTTPVSKEVLEVNLDPPHWKTLGVPLSTEKGDVLSAHRDRLSDVSQRPRRFDEASLKEFVLTETQSFVDQGLSCGRYRWLSNTELEYLRQSTAD